MNTRHTASSNQSTSLFTLDALLAALLGATAMLARRLRGQLARRSTTPRAAPAPLRTVKGAPSRLMGSVGPIKHPPPPQQV